jgi:hypothetical protein
MPDTFSPTGDLRFLRRADAAAYVTDRYFPCSRQSLAKFAVKGGGPLYRKAGRVPIYKISMRGRSHASGRRGLQARSSLKTGADPASCGASVGIKGALEGPLYRRLSARPQV